MSIKLLLDENIPPQVATALRQSGYDVIHLRDAGLKGCKNSDLIAFAGKTGRCLVTLDADFADVRYHPTGAHSGPPNFLIAAPCGCYHPQAFN
jgi:predicted nuclease of predicted toxin-antitoxin system